MASEVYTEGFSPNYPSLSESLVFLSIQVYVDLLMVVTSLSGLVTIPKR